jgi:galactokinase
MNLSEFAKHFVNLFGVQPTLVATAPGRVNLIGEHTDYNDGFVMPSAIDLCTRVAASPRQDQKLAVRSLQFPGDFTFDLDNLPTHHLGQWCDYVLGVAVVLRQNGHTLPGANLLVNGDIPMGGGLSSSAAIEVATALALLSLTDKTLPLPEVAKLCQKSENTFIGARVGIMDQFVSCLGKAGNALMLDCRSLDFQLIPIPDHARMVICNTMVKHEHASGEYNLRREECEAGVKILARWYPEIRALRDISTSQLEEHANDLPETILKRCRHVVAENERVQAGAEYLRTGPLNRFGELMRASHRSLRDLYEVSCRELNLMAEIAGELPGCYGARMTGGGFGGSTINLVESRTAQFFADQISARYEKATGIRPAIYICSAADGASIDSTA